MELRYQVESEVLKLYKKVNPSKMSAINKRKFFAKFFRQNTENWINHIKIPPSFFDSKRILDVGCGTGEYDICYALWGGKVYGIDINSHAVGYARKLARQFRLKDMPTFKICSLFDAKFDKSSFDIVICDGVLHHTANPKSGFRKLTTYVKKDGFLVINIAEQAGFFQKNIQRFIVRLLAKKNPGEMFEVSKKLFSENINRAVRFGTRSQRQIAYDLYATAQYEGLGCPEILSLAKKCGLIYYSSWPPIDLPLQVNPHNRPLVLDIQSRVIQTWLRIVQLRWLFANKEDNESLLEYLRDSAEMTLFFDKFIGLFRGISSLALSGRKAEPSDLKDMKKGIKYLNIFVEKLFNLYERTEKNIITLLQRDVKSLSDLIDALLRVRAYHPDDLTQKLGLVKKVLKGSSLFRGLNGIPSNYFVFYKK